MGLNDILQRIPTLNELKGNLGEQLAKYYATAVSDSLVLHDVLIDGKDGFTSQIDMILVTNVGLYVVEVKTYNEGKIYGDGKKKKWYYYLHGQKYEFYNPLMQNDKHIKYLKTMLAEFGEIPCFSIILLICEDIKVSNVNFDNSTKRVICTSLPAMKRTIKLLNDENSVMIDDATRQKIYNFINENQHSGKSARIEHKKQVVEYKNKLEESRANHVCPYCKIPLVKRNGKFGEFYGCANYPKCKYTEK